MNNMELMWIYRHAWRGSGLYYRKGDHVVTQESQEDKPSSMFKAMTMYPVWDKWIMPRCDTIPQRYIEDPERWMLTKIDDVRAPQEIPPLGRVRWEYLLLDQLSHEEGNLFRLWYEDLEDYERSFWHAFMRKASEKQEYRWEDFCKEVPTITEYEPVRNFDSRFFYYDHYSMITGELMQPTDRLAEEAKCEQWAIVEEDLEPGLALDPTSYAAKAMQRKRKEPPTESEVLSSVRKRPTTTPPQEGASAGSPASGATPQGQISLDTLMEAVGTPTGATAQGSSSGQFLSMNPSPPQGQGIQETVTAIDGTQTTITVTSAVTTTHQSGDQSGQSQPLEVSQPSEQMEQQAESQPVGQHPSQETVSTGGTPAEQRITSVTDHPEAIPQEELSESRKT